MKVEPIANAKLPSHSSVLIVGGGQAGLSLSYELSTQGIDHVLLEKNRAGHAWREQRWDSFCLVTPNWQCQLPGFAYPGDDPDGFMKKDEILAYLDAYKRRIAPPLYEGVQASSVQQRRGGGFTVRTEHEQLSADQVVIAIGNYHVPKIPAFAAELPSHVVQLHASEYKNPDALPKGAVLVVGTGQSGCQIAEDLHLAGRQVHLCVGGAPRVSRRYRGRDVVAWLADMGHYDLPVDKHPLKEGVRKKANHYVTGRDGGRDIDLRLFATQGMQLHGRLVDVRSGTLHFADDLAQNLDNADQVNANIKRSIDAYIGENAIKAPLETPLAPCWQPDASETALACESADIAAVIWSIGYASDFSFVDIPVFDTERYPLHRRGVTPVPGLYFLGLPWLYTWGSGRFSGIARDAAYLRERIVEVRDFARFYREAAR